MVVMLVVALVLPAEVAAAKTPKPLQGCRLLATAYDPTVDDRTQTVLALHALAKFRKVKATASLARGPDVGKDLGAWCKEHYPNDALVAKAQYPTP